MKNRNQETFRLATCVESPEDYAAEPKLYCYIAGDDTIHVALTTCPMLSSGKVTIIPVQELHGVIAKGLYQDLVTVHTTIIDSIGVSHVPIAVHGKYIENSPVEIGDLKIYTDGSFSIKDIVSDGKRGQPRVGVVSTTLTKDDPMAEQIKSTMSESCAYALIELELDHHGNLICHTAKLGASDSVTVYSNPFDMKSLHKSLESMTSILFLGMHYLGGPVLKPSGNLDNWTGDNGVNYMLADTRDAGYGHVLLVDVLGG